jgi:hypothetical protein
MAASFATGEKSQRNSPDRRLDRHARSSVVTIPRRDNARVSGSIVVVMTDAEMQRGPQDAE